MKDIVFQQMHVVPRWETHDKSQPSQDTRLSRNSGQKFLLDFYTSTSFCSLLSDLVLQHKSQARDVPPPLPILNPRRIAVGCDSLGDHILDTLYIR